MRQSHITIAQNDGMKAGLNAYMTSLGSSALEPVQEKHAELKAMSSRQRFRWYCDRFGKRVGNVPEPEVGVQVVQDDAAAEIASLKAQLNALLARVEGSTVAPVAEPTKVTKGSTRKAKKAPKWAISVVKRNGGKAKVGSTFSYTNGQGVKSTWKVTSILNDTHVTAVKQ